MSTLPGGVAVLAAAHELVADDYGSAVAVATKLGISRQLYWQRRVQSCSLDQALQHALDLGVLGRTREDGAIVLWRVDGKGGEVVIVAE